VKDIEVIDDPVVAIVALDPIRTRLLAELADPASAGALATRLGLPRQKIHYHLKALETVGLVQEVQRRLWGGLTERRLRASAAAYLIAPAAMGAVAADQRTNGSLLSIAARLIRDVASLLSLSRSTGKRLATSSFEIDIAFRSPADRDAFQDELRHAVTAVAEKYRASPHETARAYRVVTVAHPVVDSGQVGQ
jgi:DNA-binding transcriptional ArsR family regulator